MKKKRLLLTFIMASVFIFGFCGACASNDDGSRSEDGESDVSSEENVDNGASENDGNDPIVLPEIEI